RRGRVPLRRGGARDHRARAGVPGGGPVTAFDLDGRVAIVTGAGGGLGEGICGSLAAAGARVACLDVDLAKAQARAAQVGGVAVECDVASQASVDGATARLVSELGGVDILVNNAA